MMVQTLNPYSAAASKTEEILSRYRPIAPKPEIVTTTTTTCDGENSSPNSSCSSSSPHKIRHSPYLRNIWANLQARPTRTRKRGRSGISPANLKRQHQQQYLQLQHHHHHHHHMPPQFLGISPLLQQQQQQTLSFQGFMSPPPPPPLTCGGVENPPPPTSTSSIVTLPLLSSSTITHQLPQSPKRPDPVIIDLNNNNTSIDEKDLILQLKSPSTTTPTNNAVISPQPIRPIMSSITVIHITPTSSPPTQPPTHHKKPPQQIETEAEAEDLPMVISDSTNKVRMVNSAYMELVGQPECGWLDYVKNNNNSSNGKRISGEVMLQVSDDQQIISDESNGFTCWARIEWGDGKKNGMSAYCDVSRVYCESKHYLFSWRFHTTTTTTTAT